MTRVVVTGATGNVGTAVIRALEADDEITDIVGIARRPPDPAMATHTTYLVADVRDDLSSILAGADAVIHLAWAIQPSRDRSQTRSINVDGTASLLRAAATADVPLIVHASSVGAYAPGPGDRPVDETWAATGIDSSFYSRDKAAAERLLDAHERDHPDVRVVRLRPGLIFQRSAASEIRRLFMGPFFPGSLLRRGRLPIAPDVRAIRFQAVHADDVAQAYRLAVVRDVRGAFNIAAEPVVRMDDVARLLGIGRRVPVPLELARLAAAATWHARLQPTPPGWLDIAARAPIMDCTRARTELGWTPARGGEEALVDLLEGLADGSGGPTPPLDPDAGGPLRVREVLSGVGGRNS